VLILERENELDLLERVIVDACRSRGSVVLASGEAGIGKTTLVRMMRDLSAGRVRLAGGRCEPLSVPEPLGPLRDIAVVVSRLPGLRRAVRVRPSSAHATAGRAQKPL
jgi:predicted ATPase